MPYRRKYGRKTFRRKTYRRKPRTVAKTVRRVLNRALEKKFVEIAIVEPVPNTGTVVNITQAAPAQGVGEGDRVGNRVTITSMKFRGMVSDALNFGSIVRGTIIQWKDEDSTPGMSDVFENTNYPISPWHRENLKLGKLKVLWDRTWTTSGTGQNTVAFNANLTNMIKKLQFEPGLFTGKNKPYVLFSSDSAGVSHPDLQAFFTLNYTDA